MEPTNEHLLMSISRTLNEHLLPATADAETKRWLALIGFATNELMRRELGGMPARETLRNDLEALATRGEALVGVEIGASDGWPRRPEKLMPQREPEVSIEALWRRLTALTAALLRSRGRNADRAAIDAYLADVARMEAAQKISAPPATAAKKAEEVPLEQRLSAMTGYLSSRLGGGAGFAIREIKQLAGGFSNQTYRLSVGDADAARYIVIRVARGNSIQWPYTATLEEELPFIAMALDHGIPVPPQRWLETNVSLLGGVFHVMDYVRGEVLGSSLAPYAPVSDALITNAAEVLARMHRMQWQDWVGKLPARIVPRADLTITDSLDLILRRLREFLDAACLSPSPVILMLFDWLRRNRLSSTEAPVITHGDLGYHNWLFDGDRPAALLDWENVALCSPTKDLANVKDCFVPATQWDHFIRCYLDAGGRAPVDGEMRYYAVLRQLQALICTASAQEKMFTAVDPGNAEFLELGIMAREYFYRDVLKDIDDVIGRGSAS